MKKIATILILGCLVFALQAAAANLTGYISDSHCGAKHMDGSQASIDCVKNCVKGGAEPILVAAADSKIYKIANKDKVMDFLGRKVKVKGTVQGDTITVTSVAASK